MRLLTHQEIVKINIIQIKTYSPEEFIGIKDPSALEMAINQPNQNVFERELYPTLEEKIAILIINLIKKHPFHNANKRTAFMTMDITLKLNGLKLSMTTKQGIEFMVDVATSSNDNFEELKLFAVQKIKDHTKNEVN